MVLVFSGHSTTSPQIRREIERAVDLGIPLFPVRIEEVLPSGSLQYLAESIKLYLYKATGTKEGEAPLPGI